METGEERVDRTTDQDSGAELTSQGVKKMLLQLEKTVNKNRDLRTKFPNDPEKYDYSIPSFFLSRCCVLVDFIETDLSKRNRFFTI